MIFVVLLCGILYYNFISISFYLFKLCIFSSVPPCTLFLIPHFSVSCFLVCLCCFINYLISFPFLHFFSLSHSNTTSFYLLSSFLFLYSHQCFIYPLHGFILPINMSCQSLIIVPSPPPLLPFLSHFQSTRCGILFRG